MFKYHYKHKAYLLLFALSFITPSPAFSVEGQSDGNASQSSTPTPSPASPADSTAPFKISTKLLPLAVVAIAPLAGFLMRFTKQWVGVVTIDGPMTESGTAVEQLKTFFKQPFIQAIVLKINSGGGAPGTAQAIYHVVRELKARHKKPVIAWVENIAASGAFYAACSADVIIASPSAIVGSVGAVGEIWQLKNVLNNYGIGHELITSGGYKASNHHLNEVTPEQKAMFQELCDGSYHRFISDVQESRSKLNELPIEEWANGKVFNADRALEMGMVDMLGSQVTVEDVIKQMTKNSRDIFFYHPQPQGFFAPKTPKLNVSTVVDQVCDRIEQRFEQSNQIRTKLVG